MSAFLRHIKACNNHLGLHTLRPWRLDGAIVGYLATDHAAMLAGVPGWIAGADGLSLMVAPAERDQALARAAAVLGFRRRGELFDVRASPEGASLARLDRGAVLGFGVIGQGVHVNGLVRRADGLWVWVGWRSRAKPVAPGQLDNMVAGGIPAGLDPQQCLVKEAAEEASLPAELAGQARQVARIAYVMQLPEGTRRDVMHVYDLIMPEGVTPRPNDDEVERFELWPVRQIFDLVRDTAEVKFNVNLALIDLFLREGLITANSAEARALRRGLQGPL